MRFASTLTIIAATLVAGCDATGQIGREGSPIWNLRNMSSADKNAYFESKCAQYGYEAGTDKMRDCIADERRAAAQSSAIRRLRY
jgi:hypothetical protein